MENLNEKSVSKAQQALMGQAYAVKIGELDPSDINPRYRQRILAIADSMSKSELEKFASTKHKNLPEYVDEELDENETKLSIISADEIPEFEIKGPCGTEAKGPRGIIPFLNTDVKQKKPGKKNLENLKDYRDWLNSKNK